MRALAHHLTSVVSTALLACGKGGHDHHAPAAPDAPAEHGEHAAHERDAAAHAAHTDHADHSKHHDHGAMLLTQPSSIVRLGLLDPPKVGPQTLRLEVLRPDKQRLTGMRRAPELQLVVYVVRSDLSSFARFEATPDDGAFVITPTFAPGGYHLYGTTDSEDYDFQIAPVSFVVDAMSPPLPLPGFAAAQVDGTVTATLTLDPSPLRAGDLNGELTFATAAGPLTDLDPMRDGYLDALVVGTDMTTLSLIHTHGRTPIPGQPSRPVIKFHTRVAAGSQRLFVVVQRHGKPLTFAWTLDVAPATAPTAP